MNRFAELRNFFHSIYENKDFLYIIQPCSIGDVLYTGGLSYAVQKRKNKEASVLVLLERMKNLGITYKNLAGIIYLPSYMSGATEQYFYQTGDYEGDNYIYGHFRNEGNGYVFDDNLNMIDRCKKNIFNIPLDAEFIPPVVFPISEQNINELNEKYILDKSRTIIILPHAHTLELAVPNFWEVLVQQLKARGYIVYTNTDGIREKPVEGTEAISPNFRELFFISDKVKCFIGIRNGIFDFLAMTKARLMNISTFAQWWFCDLSIMYPNCNNRTFYDAVNYLRPIAAYFQKEKVKAQINLSHEKINPKDIFYSYKEMLTAMLQDLEKM